MFIMTTLNAKEESLYIGKVDTISINSSDLNMERVIKVYAPDSYALSDSQLTYPVLYLLDGERHLNHAILATRLLSEIGKAPELIIVAITNKDEDTRQQDLQLSKDKFTRFLKEVRARVNSSYRTSGHNSLFGHSLAGFYVVSLLAEHPELFDNYIAASPALTNKDENLFNKIASMTNEKLSKKSLYFSSAPESEEGKKVAVGINNFLAELKALKSKRIRWHYDLNKKQTHITNYYPSFFDGVLFVFNSE